MDIAIDLSGIPTQDPLSFVLFIFLNGGWLVFPLIVLIFIFPEIKRIWRDWRKAKYKSKWQYVVLSINAPRLNEQLPNAVENIFTALSGTWKRVDWFEKYFVGKTQVKFSFELISRGGFIEYVIRAPRHYRDLVEAAIYAQYPSVDIAEIPDYTTQYRSLRWPDNDGGYDMWGAELELKNKYYYPIKTWKEFGDADIKKYKDPMYALLEVLAKVGSGEEFWFQILVTPVGHGWQKKANEYSKKLLGIGSSNKSIWGEIVSIFNMVGEMVFPPGESSNKKDDSKELTSKERELAEKVQEKAAKVGFECNMRTVYIAHKEVFNKNKVKEAFLGALNQFTDLYANGIVQSRRARVSLSHRYYRRKWRNNKAKNWIMRNYCGRSGRDDSEVIMNVEELSTLWHFPLGDVKTLMLKKSGIVRSEAPFQLPTEIFESAEDKIPFAAEDKSDQLEEAVPFSDVEDGDGPTVSMDVDDEDKGQRRGKTVLPNVSEDKEGESGEKNNVIIDDGPPPPDNLPVG
ncbi:MAG: hypothetical protein WC310_01435 [Patescibacteria group bacterium]|jgi:hypothetical protein